MSPYEGKAYRAAYAMLQNQADAEEVVQEAFLKAYQHLKDFRGQARFSTWLLRTDDEVDAALRQELEAHLKACQRCWVLVDSARKTLRIVADEHIIELPAGFSERLKAGLARAMGA